jgi:hypothetical protein
MSTPHSKSEAKRLAVMCRAPRDMVGTVTWFAQCNCPGDVLEDYVIDGGEGTPVMDEGVVCKVCHTSAVAVPHVVEDRIRADERGRMGATLQALRDDREIIRRALVAEGEKVAALQEEIGLKKMGLTWAKKATLMLDAEIASLKAQITAVAGVARALREQAERDTHGDAYIDAAERIEFIVGTNDTAAPKGGG